MCLESCIGNAFNPDKLLVGPNNNGLWRPSRPDAMDEDVAVWQRYRKEASENDLREVRRQERGKEERHRQEKITNAGFL